MATLKSVFEAFCTFGGSAGPVTGLEGRMFAKMMRDAALIGKAFTATDADLVFTACKAKGAKKLTFAEFEAALDKVAAKKKVSAAEVAAAIVATGGPKSSGTQAEFNRFYDDKSNWTSTAKNGGPTNVDGNKDLKALCDRKAADARGVAPKSNFARQH